MSQNEHDRRLVELARLQLLGAAKGQSRDAHEKQFRPLAPPNLERMQSPAVQRESLRRITVFDHPYCATEQKEGGMGRVFVAEALGKPPPWVPERIALKTVPDLDEWRQLRRTRGLADEHLLHHSLVQRFRREAETCVRLGKHINIISAVLVMDIGARPYVVMEHADSGDLRQWIASDRVTPPIAVDFAIQFCRGMEYAYRTAELVHRDIKPANILIHAGRILKIADFGLARAFATSPECAASGTTSGRSQLSIAGAGTSAYMAPEQFASLAATDTRSDIFSFGAVLYEMLTKCRPFARLTSVELSRRGVPVTPVEELQPAVSPALGEIIARCLAYDPAHRYATFSDILAVLDPLGRDLLNTAADANGDGRQLPETARFNLEAFSYLSLGEWERAERCARRGTEIDPSNPGHWINCGAALGRMKRNDEAIKCFHRTVELAPDRAQPWANLSWAHLGLGQATDALSAAQRATSLEEHSAEAWFARGSCEMRLRQLVEAETSLTRGLGLAPEDWRIQIQLGICLGKMNRSDEAIARLRRGMEQNPSSAEGWKYLAMSLSEVGRNDEASLAIDHSLATDSSDAESWAIRALLLWQSGERARARAALAEALSHDPANRAARMAQALVEEHHT